MKPLMMASAILLILAGTSTWAQSPDPHHPAQNATSAPAPSTPAPNESQPVQPGGEAQQGAIVNCSMMQGQMAHAGMTNCSGQPKGGGSGMMQGHGH